MAEKKRINFIVTDLDDTIWDWLSMWHESFEPYLNRISIEFGIDISTLKSDFKKLHQKYKTSEASFIYNELQSLSQGNRDHFENETSSSKSILHEYYANKKNNLVLYDGVLETLKLIKSRGAMIVGFTESNAFFTKYRIKHLLLDGIFDCIYAPIDFDVPQNVYRHYSEEYWEPQITEFRYLPQETKKPAPEILEIILKDLKANKEHTIYVGDKLDKDIFMANQASVRSVYAYYGHKIETKQYQLLKEVTHWTDEDVQREIDYRKSHSETPIANYTLEKSFSQLTDWFSFFEFPKKSGIKPELSHIIDIWKKIIDVQQHFNDIALRIRNIALTVFTAIIGAIGYVEKEKLALAINKFTIPYSSLVSLSGCFIMFAFFYMDRAWYHKLLTGAVKQGSELESKWGEIVPEIKLSTAIGKASPHSWFRKKKIHSKNKFWIFYGLLIIPLLLLGILFIILKNCA